MGYSIDVLQDSPVLLTKWHSTFNFQDEFRNYSDEVKVLLDSFQTPKHYVIDLHDFKLESIDDLMKSTALATRSGNNNFHHSMVKSVVWITSDSVWKIAANGMKNEIYGSMDIKVFDTVDDALNYLRHK